MRETDDNNNEYQRVSFEAESILENRRNLTNQEHQWNYNREVGKLMQQQPFKYQNVESSAKVQFTDDMRRLIYDEKNFPEDLKIFNSSDWQLAPVTQSTVNAPSVIPSLVYIRSKKFNAKEINHFFGEIQLQGKIKGKANEINYNLYYFNLRSNALCCYPNDSVEAGEKQLFTILLNETTYDYRSDNPEFMHLKSDQKSLKILKDPASRQLVDILEKKLLKYAFRGAYALRNEVPNWKIEQYLDEQIDTLGPVNFHEQSAIKDIVHSKFYRESIGGFLKLLNNQSQKRTNKAGEIYYPRWLKQQYKDMIRMDTWLVTNVIPPPHSLLSLKIKINDNEKESFFHNLKYIFPYRKNYLKRSLIVYESNLIDGQASKALNSLSYPMYFLGFPNNNLSSQTLNFCIKKSTDFSNQIIDLSYNTKLTSISGARSMNLLNNNPTVKKIIIKGCQVANDDPDAFFDALASTLGLQELAIQYSDAYNESIVGNLEQFQAIIEEEGPS